MENDLCSHGIFTGCTDAYQQQGPQGKEDRRQKLTPTIKVTATRIKLKVKQSTSKIKVSRLAKGDSVKSWTSSNKKIVSVNSKGTMKA